jgi:hypothetical protein
LHTYNILVPEQVIAWKLEWTTTLGSVGKTGKFMKKYFSEDYYLFLPTALVESQILHI